MLDVRYATPLFGNGTRRGTPPTLSADSRSVTFVPVPSACTMATRIVGNAPLAFDGRPTRAIEPSDSAAMPCGFTGAAIVRISTDCAVVTGMRAMRLPDALLHAVTYSEPFHTAPANSASLSVSVKS